MSTNSKSITNIFQTGGGALGDGITDDSDAVQAVIDANVNNDRIVYFPSGNYVFFKTVKVHPGVKIAGELWAVIMAGGTSTFQDANNPKPVLQVGDSGDIGDVEITDIMFASKGAQPGAILVQWNIKQGSQGSAGMWDSHFRVGGTAGSNLQVIIDSFELKFVSISNQLYCSLNNVPEVKRLLIIVMECTHFCMSLRLVLDISKMSGHGLLITI